MIGYLSGRTDKLDMKPTPIVILQSDHINIPTFYPNNTTVLAKIQYNFCHYCQWFSESLTLCVLLSRKADTY